MGALFVRHPGVRGLDDLEDLGRVVGDVEQLQLIGADVALGQHRLLEPAEQAVPVPAADEDDRELGDLPGGDQRERLEQLVHRAEAAGEHHEGLRVLDEDGLADEEVAELHPDVHVVVEAGLHRQLDAEADGDAARLGGALVGRLHDPRAAAGDHRIAGLDQSGGDLVGQPVLGRVPFRPRRPEDGHGHAELGQQAESLDELRLDAHHPPRVCVHPVGGAAAVEQPLVGCRRRNLLVAQRHGSLASNPSRVTSAHSPPHGSHQLSVLWRKHAVLTPKRPVNDQPLTPWSRRIAFSSVLSWRRPAASRRSTSRHGMPYSPPTNWRIRVPPTQTDQAGASPGVSSAPVSTSMTWVVLVRIEPAPSTAPSRTRAPSTTIDREPIMHSSSTPTGTAFCGSRTPPTPTPPERWTFFPIWAQDPTVAQVSTIVPSSTYAPTLTNEGIKTVPGAM